MTITDARAHPMGLQIVVERPVEDVCVLTVAGVLDAAGVTRLTRVVEGQLALAESGDRATAHVVVDLSGIGAFTPGALEGLGPVRVRCGRDDIGLHLTGCQGRIMLLPLGAQRALAQFSAFPTVEVALAVLSPDDPPGALPES